MRESSSMKATEVLDHQLWTVERTEKLSGDVLILCFRAFPLTQFSLRDEVFVCVRFFPLGIVGRIP